MAEQTQTYIPGFIPQTAQKRLRTEGSFQTAHTRLVMIVPSCSSHARWQVPTQATSCSYRVLFTQDLCYLRL